MNVITTAIIIPIANNMKFSSLLDGVTLKLLSNIRQLGCESKLGPGHCASISTQYSVLSFSG